MKREEVNLTFGDSGSNSVRSGQAKSRGTIAPAHITLTFSMVSLPVSGQENLSFIYPFHITAKYGVGDQQR